MCVCRDCVLLGRVLCPTRLHEAVRGNNVYALGRQVFKSSCCECGGGITASSSLVYILSKASYAPCFFFFVGVRSSVRCMIL